jgi:hypothetical protein
MKCLTKDCKNSIWARGLCLKCYMAAYQQKRREGVTWKQMADQGRALLKKTRRKKSFESRVMELLAAAGSAGMTRTQLNWHVKLTTETLLNMVRKMQIQTYRVGNHRTYYYPGMRPRSLEGIISFLQ